MTIQYYKSFGTLQEQLHEEEVLFNEALRMHALPNVLQEIKELIAKHKSELSRQNYYPTSMPCNNEDQSFQYNV